MSERNSSSTGPDEIPRPPANAIRSTNVATPLDPRAASDLAARVAIAESEARYRAIVDSMPQVAWSVDRRGQLEWLNARWTEYTGRAVDASLRDARECVHPDDLARVLDAWQRAFETGAMFEVEYRLRRHDGVYRWHLARAVPTRDDAGRITRWFATATDIEHVKQVESALVAAERRAREQSEALAALMDAVPAAIWIARDRDCREIVGNRRGHELLEVPAGTNLSKSGDDDTAVNHFGVFRGDVEVAPEDLPMQRAAREGIEIREFEEELRFADGRRCFLYGSAVPLRDNDGTPRGSIGAFIDVTALKRVEAALRENERNKDEFLAMISHELRNPLAPILTAVHLMKASGDVSTPKQRQIIERQVRHMTRLVDDLLDTSRLARGTVDLDRRRLEIGEVVANAIEMTAPAMRERSHALEADVQPEGMRVSGDETRLSQVFSNLLTNAARYTPEGGRIRVSARRESAQIVVEIADNGIGISRELLPRIFDMFVQGPSRTKGARSGLGLGLGIVRQLVSLHGGSVEAHSDGDGCGSRFVVRLPALEPAAS